MKATVMMVVYNGSEYLEECIRSVVEQTFLREHSLCYRDYPYAEDYKLWVDMSVNGAKFWVIPEYLVKYRMSNRQVSRVFREEQSQTTQRIIVTRNDFLTTFLA